MAQFRDEMPARYISKNNFKEKVKYIENRYKTFIF